MTYSTSNPPQLMLSIPGQPKWWSYTSADAAATVEGAGYITDGQNHGMAPNDLVFINDTATPLTTVSRVEALPASGTAVNLSVGVTIGNTT